VFLPVQDLPLISLQLSVKPWRGLEMRANAVVSLVLERVNEVVSSTSRRRNYSFIVTIVCRSLACITLISTVISVGHSPNFSVDLLHLLTYNKQFPCVVIIYVYCKSHTQLINWVKLTIYHDRDLRFSGILRSVDC